MQHRPDHPAVTNDDDVTTGEFGGELVQRRDHPVLNLPAGFPPRNGCVTRIERFDLRAGQTLRRAVVSFDQSGNESRFCESEIRSYDLSGLDRAAEGAGHNHIPRAALHFRTSRMSLSATRLVEGDICRTLNLAGKVPVGFAVSDEEEVCHHCQSTSAGSAIMETVSPAAKVTFVDAVVAGFRKAVTFGGTASRPEFWYWILFSVLIRLVTTTADAFVYPEDINLDPNTIDLDSIASELATAVQHSFASVTFAAEIILLVPTISLTMRRFRDASWKPWLAGLCYLGIYASLAGSLVIASSMLSILTIAGGVTGQETTIVGGFLALVFAVLVQFASVIIIVIGASQPTKRTSAI